MSLTGSFHGMQRTRTCRTKRGYESRGENGRSIIVHNKKAYASSPHISIRVGTHQALGSYDCDNVMSYHIQEISKAS